MGKRKKLILISAVAFLAVILILTLVLMSAYDFSCANLEVSSVPDNDFSAITDGLNLTGVITITPDNGKGWILPKQVTGKLMGALGVVHEADLPPYFGPYSLDIFLTNIASGYSLHNGHWGGWCVDSNITFREPFITFTADVYSSLDLAGVPAYAKDDEQWDKINYILNHKGTAEPWDIQLAIWYFSDAVFNTYYQHTPGSLAIIADANANGTGFVPGAGQFGAVILDCGPQNQLFFIEVDP